MTLVLLGAFLGLQAGFIWARYRHFRVHGATPQGVRLIELSAIGGLALGAFLMAAASLFAWALTSTRPRQLSVAFADDAPTELVTTGAFALVRNPFYVAYMSAFAIPWAASGSVWGFAFAVWMAFVYRRAALAEEQKFLSSPLAGDFERYAASTGRFLPRPSRVLRLLRRAA
jgi:protein-S-isoprenylcysteine O-methyltransferase Ste14